VILFILALIVARLYIGGLDSAISLIGWLFVGWIAFSTFTVIRGRS
jgi:hypothetical protein